MIEIQYTVKLLSSLRVGTGIGSAGFLDNTVVRRGGGEVYLPGATIKGKVKAAVQRFAPGLGFTLPQHTADSGGCLLIDSPCMLCRIFGASHYPCQLEFENALLPQETIKLLYQMDENRQNQKKKLPARVAHEFAQAVRTNVSLDRRTRTSRPDHLFTAEAIDPQALFSGCIHGLILQPGDEKKEGAVLIAALQSITHLGAARGRGLGRCEITVTGFKVNSENIPVANALALLGGAQ